MVLVVDDTKNIRNLLTQCLEINGYEVRSAANGQAALEIIKECREDIEFIFLDIRMPEITGTEVLKTIRSMGITSTVIIMTAFATIKNAVDCTKMGAVAYLQKPFTADRVKNLLKEIAESQIEVQASSIEGEANSYILKGKQLMEEEEFSEALKSFKVALSINPSDSELYFFIGEAYKKLNNREEAEKFYKASKIFI